MNVGIDTVICKKVKCDKYEHRDVGWIGKCYYKLGCKAGTHSNCPIPKNCPYKNVQVAGSNEPLARDKCEGCNFLVVKSKEQ